MGDNQKHIASILHIFENVGALSTLVKQVLHDEIETCESLNSLFRHDSKFYYENTSFPKGLNTILLDTYMQMVGHDYLVKALKPFVQDVIKEKPQADVEGCTPEGTAISLR